MPDKKNKAPRHRPVQSPSGDVLIRARTRGLSKSFSKTISSFENDLDDLISYCKSSGRSCFRLINDYHIANLELLLKFFPKEEIAIAIDIAKTHGVLRNWVKYTAGILWKREKEGKAIREI